MQFENIALKGHGIGTLVFNSSVIEWSGRGNVKSWQASTFKHAIWSVFGLKASLKISSADSNIRFDGFSKSDYESVSTQFTENFQTNIEKQDISAEGSHFGIVAIHDKSLTMKSISDKTVFDMSLENLAQCVIPTQNRDELEIQFQESDTNRDEDCLVQITLHFPPADEDEDEDEDEDKETQAEIFQKSILSTGVIQSVTGNIIVEFGKEVRFIFCY